MRGLAWLVFLAAVSFSPSFAVPTAFSGPKDIKFLPNIVNNDCSQDPTPCLNHWWMMSDSTGTVLYYTAGSASLEFSFQGGLVTLYGRRISSGGRAILILDNGSPSTIDFKSADGTESETIWQQGSLDKTAKHTIMLSYQAPPDAPLNTTWPIVIQSFEVDTSGTSNPSAPSQTGGSDSDRVVSLAAGLSGGLALLLAVMACVFYWYRRRRQARPQYENVRPSQLGSRNSASGGYPPSHGPSMRNLPDDIDPFILAEAQLSTNQITTNRSANPQRVYHLHTSSSTALLPSRPHGLSPVPSQSSNHHALQPVLREQGQRPHVDTAPASVAPPERPWIASPTETTHSYESWTSSDFGPVPSPFIANGPPVPVVPPHLASSVEKGVRRKARSVRTARQSNATTLPPYTENMR